MAALHPRTVGLAITASAAASALWLGLAWSNPTSTYHFAPLIAAFVGPYLVRTRDGRLPRGAAARVTGLSGAVVVATIIVLATGDRLRGPTFWSDDGALLEAALFAVAGAVGGFFAVRTPDPGRSAEGASGLGDLALIDVDRPGEAVDEREAAGESQGDASADR